MREFGRMRGLDSNYTDERRRNKGMSNGGKPIVRGYWNCPYCESKDIDGLVDDCPNCGRHKPENTKYHMKLGAGGRALSQDVLSESQLNAAGISVEECDGDHKEWVCDYCNSLNNWADMFCKACGSAREDASKEYGMKDIVLPKPITFPDSSESRPTHTTREEERVEPTSKPHQSKLQSLVSKVKRKVSAKTAAGIIGGGLFVAAIAWLFWPIKEVQTATNFSWNRSIVIEEERTVKENGWSVPYGGRVYSQQQEIHHYEKVIDHYETVTEQKSRQVLDHYETVTVQRSRQVVDHYEYSYTDNGNGTFTEHSSPVYTTEYYTDTEQKPVYKTEHYTETHQEPVYKDEPVYQTKYYYEIDKWFTDYTSDSAGNDKEPYWNTNYTLEDRERDSLRYEYYYIYYTNKDGQENRVGTDFDEWSKVDYGDQIIVTTSHIGIDYKVESIEKGE